MFLQLWLKAELAKKADANSGPLAEIGECFLYIYNSTDNF